MHIQLISGKFSNPETLDLLAELIHVKIRFHENKIKNMENEEDIKMRERRIKKLQQDLYEARRMLQSDSGSQHIQSIIELN